MGIVGELTRTLPPTGVLATRVPAPQPLTVPETGTVTVSGFVPVATTPVATAWLAFETRRAGFVTLMFRVRSKCTPFVKLYAALIFQFFVFFLYTAPFASFRQ